jgi:hypothetical protein
MKLENYNYELPTISFDSKIKDLKTLLDRHDTEHAVILDDKSYVGIMSKDILDSVDDNDVIYDLKDLIKEYFLPKDYTLFDWIKIRQQQSIDSIPLINVEGVYEGQLNTQDVLNRFKHTGLLVELSSVLVLRKDTADFNYSEVFQIAEANGAKVFGSYIQDSSKDFTDIVINIYHTGLNELLQSYRRYEYDIVSFHDEDLHHEILKENSDYFSKYLTV